MVEYRMAHPGGEYNRLYALMKKETGQKEPIGWPVVVAVEDKRVIGFLGTYPTENALIAGPLVIEGSRRPFVFLRLAEAYENILKTAGVKAYVFRVDKANEAHLARIRSMELKQIDETDQFVSFVREL